MELRLYSCSIELTLKNIHAVWANVWAVIIYFYTHVHALLDLWVVKVVPTLHVVKVGDSLGQGPAIEIANPCYRLNQLPVFSSVFAILSILTSHAWGVFLAVPTLLHKKINVKCGLNMSTLHSGTHYCDQGFFCRNIVWGELLLWKEKIEKFPAGCLNLLLFGGGIPPPKGPEKKHQ